jgi:hypothetical protein
MYIGFAANSEQKQRIEAKWPVSIGRFVSDLSELPDGTHTIVVHSLRDFNVGVVKLHELSKKHTLYSCEVQPDNALEFFAGIETNARRHRSRVAAEKRRAAGKPLGPRPLIERLPKRKIEAIRASVMEPDVTVNAICKLHGIDRRTLTNNFGDELRGMGKL